MFDRKPLASIINDSRTSGLSTPSSKIPSPTPLSSSSCPKKMSPMHSLEGLVKAPFGEREIEVFHTAFNNFPGLEIEGLMNTPHRVYCFSGKENLEIDFDELASSIGNAMLSGVQESSKTPLVKIGADGLECSGLKANDNSAFFSARTDEDWSDSEVELNGGVITDTDDSVGYIDACDKFQEEDDGMVAGGLVVKLFKDLHEIGLKEKRMTGFTGKHTKFVYGSDDEIIEKEEVCHGDAEFDSYYDCKSNGDDDDKDDYDPGKEGGPVWELYKGFSLRSFTKKEMPEFLGKHTRFVYNSEDEIEGEEVVTESSDGLRIMFCV